MPLPLASHDQATTRTNRTSARQPSKPSAGQASDIPTWLSAPKPCQPAPGIQRHATYVGITHIPARVRTEKRDAEPPPSLLLDNTHGTFVNWIGNTVMADLSGTNRHPY